MLALDIELKYNPIHRLFNKQVVPGVGELNKYEERQELRKWTSLKTCFCWLRARIQLYSTEFFFLILSDWYKSNWHFYVKKIYNIEYKKNKCTESQLFHYVNVKFWKYILMGYSIFTPSNLSYIRSKQNFSKYFKTFQSKFLVSILKHFILWPSIPNIV